MLKKLLLAGLIGLSACDSRSPISAEPIENRMNELVPKTQIVQMDEREKSPDFNRDHQVYFDDFDLFADNFGDFANKDNDAFDLNSDHLINNPDFDKFKEFFGATTNSPPKIQRIEGKTRLNQNETTTLTAAVSDYENDDIVAYEWSINDNPVSTNETLTTTFPEGENDLELKVMDEFGGVSTKERKVIVNDFKNYSLKVFLESEFTEDLDFAREVLPIYVEDMNTILEKNTNVNLSLESIEIVDEKQFTGSGNYQEDFEVWMHVGKAKRQDVSENGYCSIDRSGACVLVGDWTKLYDPLELDSPNDLYDYWSQISNSLHEFEHCFSAGFGEYYSLIGAEDNTGVDPKSDIKISPSDAYWKDNQDFFRDPLLMNFGFYYYHYLDNGRYPISRSTYLDNVQLSELSARLMEENFRCNLFDTLPDLTRVKLEISDNDIPLENANVQVFRQNPTSPHDATLLYEVQTSFSGEVYLDLSNMSFVNSSLLTSLKISKEGYCPQTKYVSIFDAQEEKVLRGNKDLEIMVELSPQ